MGDTLLEVGRQQILENDRILLPIHHAGPSNDVDRYCRRAIARLAVISPIGRMC